MAGNNNENARSSSPHEKKSARMNICSQRWENAKLDIFRMYIQENRSLKATMAAIQGTHGIHAGERRWKDKLDEWDYQKNLTTHEMQFMVAKGMKRAREDKDTEFRHRGTPVASKKIENFKKRKTRELLPSVATPPNVTYHTPSPNSERASPEESSSHLSNPCKPSNPSNSCNSCQVLSFSIPYAGSIVSTSLERERLTTYKTEVPQLPQVPIISMLDRYMSNGDEPWSPYHLSHQLGNHNTVLDDIKDLFQELENLNLSDGQNSSPTLCYPDNQFLLDSNSSDDSEESEEISEVAALDNLLGLAVTLAESYIDYGRFAPQTLWQEFSLAKAVEANGNHKEAEYHCRRILSQCSQASVESFLGMILANASRLEESMLCFSHALTCFIIRFGNYSVPQNAVVFSPIESLLTELILRSEQDLTPLTSCVCQMLGAIRRAISEGTILQISPDLFIYGLSFAHQCSVLGFTDSAKCMFRDLLKYSTLHLNVILHAKEKATAHQRYGLLLRKERNWTASAEQLLLACDSARNSGPHAIRLKILLERDYVELLPLLAFGPNEEDSIAERIRERLDLIQDPTFSLIQNNLEAAQASPINEFLQSALPIPLATLERSATSHTAQFGLCSAPTESAQRTGAPTSTESLSTGVSNPYGLTFSNGSGNSYVSNSVYMAA